jgi:hypothetical protein
VAIEADLTYAIAVLEFSNEITHCRSGDISLDEERKGWPDIEGIPRRYFGIIIKLQVQAT